MGTPQDFLNIVKEQDRPLVETLIAVADTKLVLGNWHLICLHNAKTLPDYAAILAMASASFGHARAIYDFLGGFGLDFIMLERERDATSIHSLGMLDTPPSDWQDFVVSVHLADQACWLLMSQFLSHPNRILSGLARRVGEETYFHQKWVEGWAQQFGLDTSKAGRAKKALLQRYPQGLTWFCGTDAKDDLTAEQTELFNASARDILQRIGAQDELPQAALNNPQRSDSPLRRESPLPAPLFELARFKDPEAAP